MESIIYVGFAVLKYSTELYPHVALAMSTFAFWLEIISSNTKKIIKKFLKTYQIHNMNFIVTSALFSKEVKIKKIMRRFRLAPEDRDDRGRQSRSG